MPLNEQVTSALMSSFGCDVVRLKDLVNEKIKTQQLNNERERLTSELDKIGLNTEKLMAAEQAEDERSVKLQPSPWHACLEFASL